MLLYPISRSELIKLNPILINRANSFSQADIFKIEYRGTKVILKDFSMRPWIYRVTLGRYILKREVRALKLLEEIPNVPSFLGMVDKNAFLMEMVTGNRLPRKDVKPPSLKAFTTMQSVIKTIHNLGVTHNDIRRTNIILDHDDTPYLIDFATAFFRFSSTGTVNTLRDAIFTRCCHIDTIKILKLKKYYYTDSLTLDEEMLFKSYPLLMKIAEVWRKSIYRPLLKQAHWKERFNRLQQRIAKIGRNDYKKLL
jgi:tRNA A-37 threonylcarbamoyl transferase component Bud32